ncbi:MAG: DoxX family membrane protein [Sphingomicrobium sp.]
MAFLDWTRRFPFVTLSTAVVLARVGTASFFGAHAIVRIANGSIPRFAGFMESVGFPNGAITVWAITLVELAAAMAILLGIAIRGAAAALLSIAFGGIVLIHRHSGWFVGEHGTGGMEYSFALILLLVIIAAADRGEVVRPAGKCTESG